MRRFVFVLIVFVSVCNSFAQNVSSLQKKTGALYNEAKINAQAGDKVKAIALLNQVIKSDPRYYMAFFGLADIYHETGDRHLEREALIDGLKVGSDQFPKGYRFLAELL